MSQENVDLARQAYEAWNRGDLDWFLDHMTEDFEFRPGLGFADLDAVYRGKGGWRRFAETWREAWEDITVRVERIEDVDDRIVALLTFDGKGRGSGVEVSLRVGQVATVTEARISKLVSTPDWDEALEAVGLSEQTVSQEHAIRVGYRALSNGDVDAFLETLDPDIELLTSGAFPDFEPSYRGHDGLRRFWAAIRAPWEWFHLDPERIVEGEDCAAVAVRFRARGKGSGVSTDLQQGHALWFRHGRTVKVSTHQSFEQALEAAGLRD